MTPSAEQTAKRSTGIAQYVVDVVINLVLLLGPDPAASVRTEPVSKAHPKG
ncbi:hypothetical protein P1P68_05915 [Streptomyces scabiei]|uniref:hypothetical protein n=1 Tax=Streptomyces scabiei TaxID=1930 RepID=UPI00298F6438|nr:hypothetical protein [Streptomyces scabiei]MDW8804338.1 hypothetical protein [Streptomyces scabiei]